MDSTPSGVGTEPYILTIGDIGVSRNWVVTPNGTAKLAGSQWIVRDLTRTGTRIPAWAIVLAIVFALLCRIGLLFLLVKETYTTGYVEVSVNRGTLFHVTQLPAATRATCTGSGPWSTRPSRWPARRRPERPRRRVQWCSHVGVAELADAPG